MNFSQGHSWTKVRYVTRACFPKEKHQNSHKMGEIHELFVLALSLVWFAGPTPEWMTNNSQLSNEINHVELDLDILVLKFEPKLDVSCAYCPKEEHPNSHKMGEIHELFVLPLSLVWFAGATPEHSKFSTAQWFTMATPLVRTSFFFLWHACLLPQKGFTT